MRKISKHERDMAMNVVLWFVDHGGEMGTDGLSRLTNVPEQDIKAWAIREGLLWETGDSLSISALPLAWETFRGQSRTCQALAEAYIHLQSIAPKGSQFQKWVGECAKDPTLRSLPLTPDVLKDVAA